MPSPVTLGRPCPSRTRPSERRAPGSPARRPGRVRISMPRARAGGGPGFLFPLFLAPGGGGRDLTSCKGRKPSSRLGRDLRGVLYDPSPQCPQGQSRGSPHLILPSSLGAAVSIGIRERSPPGITLVVNRGTTNPETGPQWSWLFVRGLLSRLCPQCGPRAPATGANPRDSHQCHSIPAAQARDTPALTCSLFLPFPPSLPPFLSSHNRSTRKFPGIEPEPPLNLCHSCGNAQSLPHCAGGELNLHRRRRKAGC